MGFKRQKHPTREIQKVTTAGAPTPDSYVQFGDELVALHVKGAGKGAAKAVAGGQASAETNRLHIVVQNGRLFQQLHPDVEVLHDRGRYLLVDVDPAKARKLRDKHGTCYAIQPLGKKRLIFDVRDRAAARTARVSAIKNLVDAVSRQTYEATLKHLVSFPTRNSTTALYRQASQWAKDQLKAMNYTTKFQNITVNGKASRNVIADKKGKATSNRGVILVTAHLDSINLQDGINGSAPGADDNGSGAAGVLEIARVFRSQNHQHDLRFILFGGEEQGLFGSRHYVAKLSAAERARIRSVINMDMIASKNTPVRTVLLEGAALSQRVIDGLSTAAATYTTLKVETSLNPFNSDHVPFINAGIATVLTIEGADSTNQNIHSANDKLNTINYELALAILRMNVAFVAADLGGIS